MFLSFLRSHFSLANFSPQSNNYVVFDDMFASCQRTPESFVPAPHAASSRAPAVTSSYDSIAAIQSTPAHGRQLHTGPRPAPASDMLPAAASYRVPSYGAPTPAVDMRRERVMDTETNHLGQRTAHAVAVDDASAANRRFRILHFTMPPNTVTPSVRAVPGCGWVSHGVRAPGSGQQWTGGRPARDGFDPSSIWLDNRNAYAQSARGATASHSSLQRGAATAASPASYAFQGTHAIEDRGLTAVAARRARMANGRPLDDPWLSTAGVVSPTRLQRPF
jgi:hypothetical protein